MKIDPYDALTIYRGTRVSIVFHLYCCSKHKLSTILIAIVANLSRFVSSVLFILSLYSDWIERITIMGYSKYELNTINMLYPMKKFLIYYCMRNFYNMIGLEQWYFSLI